MSSSPQFNDPQRQRFDNYEVDSRAGELRKHGYRVRLEARPFRALEILLKHVAYSSGVCDSSTRVELMQGANSVGRGGADSNCMEKVH